MSQCVPIIEGRVQSVGTAGSILFDPAIAAQADPRWFDPDYWRAAGVMRDVQGGRGGVQFVTAPFGDVVLRHYRRGGLVAHFNRDRYLWEGAERTRAFKEWRLLATLRSFDLPVPAPVAARYLRAGLFYRADLITRTVDGARTLAQRLPGVDLTAADWAAVGHAIAEFHRQGAYHADLNAHNVLFDAAAAVWLIDFDRGELRDPESTAWQTQNLERLRRSLVKVSDVKSHDKLEAAWRVLIDAYQQRRASS